jgi:hypothetical protein
MGKLVMTQRRQNAVTAAMEAPALKTKHAVATDAATRKWPAAATVLVVIRDFV